MKNKLVKRIAVLMAAAIMSMSVMACGDKAQETAVEETVDEAVEETAEEAADIEETTEAADTEAADTEAADTEAADTEVTADTEESAAGEALTVEEYEEKVIELTDSMTQAQTDLESVDQTDVESMKEFVKGVIAPYEDFIAVTAPEKYAPAHEKFVSACEAMIAYFNACVDMMDMEGSATEEEVKEVTENLTNLLTTAQTDFTEAATLMDEASAE